MEAKGVIEDILLKTKDGGKSFYKVRISGKTYNTFPATPDKTPIEAFNQLKENQFKVGEIVDFQYDEHPGETLTGEPVMYKNLNLLCKTVQPKEAPLMPVSGETREQRIIRMNCVTNAIGFLNLNKELLISDYVEGTERKLLDTKKVLEIADEFRNYVTK